MYRCGVILEHDLLAAAVAEVDDDVGPLGWAECQQLQRDRRRQQTLVTANLMEGESVLVDQMQEARVRSIHHPEAILARLDFEIGKEFAVDQDGIAGNVGNPGCVRVSGDGVVQLARRA